MLVSFKLRSSLCNNIRPRCLEASAAWQRRASSSKQWQDNRSSQNSKGLSFFLGATAIGIGAGSVIYFYPQLFKYFEDKTDKNTADPKTSSNALQSNLMSASKGNPREQEIRKLREQNSRFCGQLDSFKDKIQRSTVEVLVKIDESAVEGMSTETFLQLYYKIFTTSTQLLHLWNTFQLYSKKLKNVTTQIGDVDSSLRNELLSSRDKLLSVLSEFGDNFSKLSFPPMEKTKLKEYWDKYYGNFSDYPDYATSPKTFLRLISQQWEPADEQESDLRDKIVEVLGKLEQLECLLVEQFERKVTPALNVIKEELLDTDEESFDRRTVDEIVKIKVEEEREKFEMEFKLKVADEKERLKIELGEELYNKLQTVKVEYAHLLAESLTKLHAIESAVDKKASSQKRALFSHYMWLACESLRSQLFRDVELGFCSARATELEELLKPLHQFVRKIEVVNSEENNPFVASIVASVPEIARTRGVYTEQMLKLRCNRVITTCYRLVDVRETRNSVCAHVWSYIKAALSIRSSKDVPLDVDLEMVDNYSLLQYAECVLERGDIGICVKILNQLKGKPAEVVQDWLNEARLFLETKQAAHCLSLFSTATGFSGSPLA